MKICSKCKLEQPDEFYHKHPNCLSGLNSSCKDCVKKACSSINIRYSNYKSDAKRRGHNWDLTKKKFVELWENNCYYCNDAHTFGIDRIDNNIGYYDSNVVSCCSTCNYAKGTMSTDAFLLMIEKIYKNIVRR